MTTPPEPLGRNFTLAVWSRFACAALLDTSSSQSPISATAWDEIKTSGAPSTYCEQVTNLRSWGGFGTLFPLKTTTYVRLSVQFLSGEHDQAALAVWTYVVPLTTMSRLAVIGRVRWMPFDCNSHRNMPPRQSNCRNIEEFLLSYQDIAGAWLFVPVITKTYAAFHLRHNGTSGVSLSPISQLVDINLVCCMSAAALTVHY